jgi:hypothetical protein
MSDGVVYITLVVGFGFVIVAGARLGAGSHSLLGGLFPASGVRDWPMGVQEADAPRFAVAHLDGLRPDHPVTVDVAPISADDPVDAPRIEVIDLGFRRLDAPRA